MDTRRHKMLIHTNIEIPDHENIGKHPLLVVIACIVMQILTDTGFPVMAALINRFRVESRTPDPAATLFYDQGGKLHQKIGFILVALFT